VANINSPEQVVISGDEADVIAVVEKAKAYHARGVLLPVSAPFHCPLMEPARLVLEQAFASVPFHDASLPVYSDVDGEASLSGETLKQKVLLQTTHPVQWVSIVENAAKAGFDTFVEAGPGHTLSAFVKKIVPEMIAYNGESYADFNQLFL